MAAETVIQVDLPEQLLAEAEKCAEVNGKTLEEVVEWAVIFFLHRQGH